MAKKSISISFNNLMTNSSILSDNIKENAGVISRYGLDVPAFTAEMEADVKKATELSSEQARLKSRQKELTLELNGTLVRIQQRYSRAKRTVKLAEPQAKWVGYGIKDKK